MKKITFMLIALVSFSVSAQKKKNGTVYIDHPAIDMIESFQSAWVSGDIEKAGSYLHENFKIFNATSENKEQKGSTKAQMINNMSWWYNNMDYLKIERSRGAYPDAIEYKEGNQLWVQTWDHLYGVNKQTGVKFDSPIHRLYLVSNDSKQILNIQEYNNANSFRRINMSWTGKDRKNGVIYINHENINTVRKAISAAENGDFENVYANMTEDAMFNDINYKEPRSLSDIKAGDEVFNSNFDIINIDQVGYPDYLEYDLNEGRSVLSWWNYKIVRKSDKKEISVPVHFIHNFNKDGKINGGSFYYNASLFQ